MTDDESADPQGDGWSRFSAYELELKARYLLGQRSVARVQEAAVLIEEVLQKHPSFAPAYVTLAEGLRERPRNPGVPQHRP